MAIRRAKLDEDDTRNSKLSKGTVITETSQGPLPSGKGSNPKQTLSNIFNEENNIEERIVYQSSYTDKQLGIEIKSLRDPLSTDNLSSLQYIQSESSINYNRYRDHINGLRRSVDVSAAPNEYARILRGENGGVDSSDVKARGNLKDRSSVRFSGFRRTNLEAKLGINLFHFVLYLACDKLFIRR
jgi:hypothetical protein